MSDGIEEEVSLNAPIEIVIYLHDNSGILLKIKDGQNIDASSLFELVIKEIGFDESDLQIVREVFSLWLISDLLELQLKSNHIPFKLVCYWEELLEKHVHCSEETRQRDEPVIMLRRNVYVPLAVEEGVDNEYLLKLLCCEASKNFIDGRYPVDSDQADKLALLQAQIISLEETNESTKYPSLDFFFEHLKELLPAAYCKRNLLLNRKQNPEHRLSSLCQAEMPRNNGKGLVQLYTEYLRLCRNGFPYGSAFFRGQAEHRGKKVDDPVWIAVNRRGVAIICINEQTILLSTPFEKLSWQFAESTSIDQNYLPCLFLHFPYLENDLEVSKLLQIFSRSALLADNLIEAFVDLKKRSSSDAESTEHIEVAAKVDRLALITFDGQGNKTRSTIRLPKNSLKLKESNEV